jgi:hypothetical protein
MREILGLRALKEGGFLAPGFPVRFSLPEHQAAGAGSSSS